MFLILVDLFTIVLLLVGGRIRDAAVGTDCHPESPAPAADAPLSPPHDPPPGGRATGRPQPASFATPTLNDERPVGYLYSETSAWTELDDRQLTRLLEQSAS